jgi:hypothetical protein
MAMTTQLRSRFAFFTCLALLVLGTGQALTAAGSPNTPWSMSGSALGFVFDPQGHALRPLLGIPGASIFGKTVGLSVDLAEAIVAPAGDHALAITRDSELVEIRQIGSVPAVRPVLRTKSVIDVMRLSPMGGEAILYRRAANTYQLVTNLPGVPVAGPEFDLPASHGSLTALALADGGRAALAGFSDGESGAIYLLSSTGQPALVSAVRHPSSITFLSHSHDALIADKTEDKIYLLRNVTGNVATLLIADKGEGVAGPVAVEASRDGKQIFAANARSRTVLTVELENGAHVLHSCHCVPTTLSHLKGNALYRITEPSKGPIWLFDGDAPHPRVVFVPAFYAGSNQEKQ